MFEWIFLIFEWVLAPFSPAAAEIPQPYYVGIAAAEVAYADLLPEKAVDNRVDREDCTVCNGTGRVRSGDGQGWTKCSNCKPPPEELKEPAAAAADKTPPSMRLQSKPLETPGGCVDGNCPPKR